MGLPWLTLEVYVPGARNVHIVQSRLRLAQLWGYTFDDVTITAVLELNSRIVSFVNCFDFDLTGAIDSIQKGVGVFPWLSSGWLQWHVNVVYIQCLYTDFYASDHQTTLDLSLLTFHGFPHNFLIYSRQLPPTTFNFTIHDSTIIQKMENGRGRVELLQLVGALIYLLATSLMQPYQKVISSSLFLWCHTC